MYLYVFIDIGKNKWQFAFTQQGKEEEKNEVEIVLYLWPKLQSAVPFGITIADRD